AEKRDTAIDGVPPRTSRAHLAPARPLRALDLQRCPEPRVRQLDRSPARLLLAAVDDAHLRRLLGLGFRTPRDRLRVVLRRPRVPHRPRLVRPGPPGPVRARVRLSYGGLPRGSEDLGRAARRLAAARRLRH